LPFGTQKTKQGLARAHPEQKSREAAKSAVGTGAKAEPPGGGEGWARS